MKPILSLLLVELAMVSCATSTANFAPPDLAGASTPVPGVVAAGRIELADVVRLRQAGIRHVIDLTRNEETPDFDEAAAVRNAGIDYSNLPLRGAEDLTLENVRAFDALLGEVRRPLLVHCASGNRVGAMAALRAAWIEGRPVEDAVAIGKAWGLKSLEAEVRRRIELDADATAE